MQNSIRSRRSARSDADKSPEPASQPLYQKDQYVMAKWKNNIEYLAQVLDSRLKSRDIYEYKVVFIWDNVIEWTSASLLRSASEEETKRILEDIKKLRSVKRDVDECLKKTTDPFDDNFDKFDMIYDRNHTQFQEACRKRRELQKRSVSGDVDSEINSQKTSLPGSPISSPSSFSLSTSKQDSPVSSKRTPNRKTPAKPIEAPMETSVSSSKAPPTTFQCPHCPRSLRRKSLLEAHLHNYHTNTESAPLSPNEVPSSAKKKKTDPESELQPIPEGEFQERYIFCPSCKTAALLAEPEESLIQCMVCRVWSHRRCTNQEDSKSWICTFCHREPSTSGLTDWSTIQPPSNRKNEALNVDNIEREISSLLNWLDRLKLLVHSGRNAFCRIKRQYASNVTSVQPRQNRFVAASASSTKETSVESSAAAELPIDLLFNSGLHSEEHFGSLDSPDISRLLANIPTNLPDLTITDDLLNVVQPTPQQHSVPSATSSTNSFDTPTKNLIASLFQSITPEGVTSSSNGAGAALPPPTATTIEADLQRAVPMDSMSTVSNTTTVSSPYFTTPVKTTPRSSAASVGDIEAAASLIGFSESGVSCGPSSQELESLNQEILIPLEEMIILIENRLEFLEDTVDKMISQRSSRRSQSNDEDDNDSGSRTPESSPLNPSRSPSPSSHFKNEETAGIITYPPPKFAPKRHANGHLASYWQMTDADAIVPQESAEGQVANVDDSLQIEAPLDVSATSADAGTIVTSTSKRKRRRRKRKRLTTDRQVQEEAVEKGECNVPEEKLLLGGFHSSFHGVVYDEEGNPKEITLKQDNLPQVNRKRQKRLGSCTFRWNSAAPKSATTVIPAKRGRYDTASSAATENKPKVKNLEVRIHRFENNYENVVKYWYTTLDWLDRAAMENEIQPTEENETEERGDDNSEEGKHDHNDGEVATSADELKPNEGLNECSNDSKKADEKESQESSEQSRENLAGIKKDTFEENDCSAGAECLENAEEVSLFPSYRHFKRWFYLVLAKCRESNH
ncbi:hypothetical protein Aperf_G00000052160 [Anoplocephala perfoliata]